MFTFNNNYTNFLNTLFRPLSFELQSGSSKNNGSERPSATENNSLMHLMCMRKKADQGILIDENNSCSCISFGDEWPL